MLLYTPFDRKHEVARRMTEWERWRPTSRVRGAAWRFPTPLRKAVHALDPQLRRRHESTPPQLRLPRSPLGHKRHSSTNRAPSASSAC